MTDVASEIEVRRQAGAGETPGPSGNGAKPATAASDEAAPAPTAAASTAAEPSAVAKPEPAAKPVPAPAAKPVPAVKPVPGPTVKPVPGPTAKPAEEPPVGVAERVGDQVNEVVERANEVVERAAAASGRVASAVVERLRNNAELAVERGTTSIADEVVEKIAGIAVREVPGVHDIGGDVARVLAGLKERIGLGDADDETDRGMRVRLQGRTAQVNVTLVIEYGFVVHSVAEKVRTKVINAVENLLGLEVTEVNILVDDVHVPDDPRPVG
jgi:uncharacterized alkaline shock family protein YloU